MRRAAAIFLAALAAAAAQAQAPSSGLVNGLRGPAPLETEARPALLPRVINDDQRRARSYPAQPPVIPHQTDNYQVDLRFNKCMSCHGRDRVGESQAPMVSITHYMDRDNNMRQEISPRRYFCTQCHVGQTDARVPVNNTFVDFYSVPAEAGGAPRKGTGK
jgi:nitrate reductase cytochrome c-type subunit